MKRFGILVTTGAIVTALAVSGVALAQGGAGTATGNTSATSGSVARPGPRLGGTVTAVQGSNLTLQNKSGNLTVLLNDSPVYDLGPGIAGQVSDIQVGDRLDVEGTQSSNTVTASRVHIQLPSLTGTIAQFDSSSLTLRNGLWTATVSLGSDTPVYTIAGSGSLSSLATGQEVTVIGRVQGNILAARAIRLMPAHLEGKVVSVSGNSLTISTPNGNQVIQVSASTQYRGQLAGKGLSALAAGDFVRAEGLQSGDPFAALSLDKGPAPGAKGPGPKDPGRGADHEQPRGGPEQGGNNPAGIDVAPGLNS